MGPWRPRFGLMANVAHQPRGEAASAGSADYVRSQRVPADIQGTVKHTENVYVAVALDQVRDPVMAV